MLVLLPILALAVGFLAAPAQARDFGQFSLLGGLPLDPLWTENGETVTAVHGQRAFNYANDGLLVSWNLRTGDRTEAAFACYPAKNGGTPSELRVSDTPASWDSQALYLLVSVKLAPLSTDDGATGDRRDETGALCQELWQRETARGREDGLTPQVLESLDGGRTWRLLPEPRGVSLNSADETDAGSAARLVPSPTGVFYGSNKLGWTKWDRASASWQQERPTPSALDFALTNYGGNEPDYRPFGGRPGKRYTAVSFRRLSDTRTWSYWQATRSGQPGLIQRRNGTRVARRLARPRVLVRLAGIAQTQRECRLSRRVRASSLAQALVAQNGKTVWGLTGETARVRCRGELRTPTGLLVVQRGQMIEVQVRPALVRSRNGGRSWRRVRSRVPRYLLAVDGSAPVAAFGSRGCRRPGLQERRMARWTGRRWKSLGCQPYTWRDDPASVN